MENGAATAVAPISFAIAARPVSHSILVMPSTARSAAPTHDIHALAQRAAAILLEHKANDVVLLSLRGVSDMTDYFLIASGTSDTHVRSLGNSVLEDMKKETGQVANHSEGLPQGRWVLLDYVDFVVHVFHPTLRNFYQIERLWADAQVIPLTASVTR